MRLISHFSAGAASAIATKLSHPDEIWYAETGGEDIDNERFLKDCEKWFGMDVRRIKSKKYDSTWQLWEAKSYLAGPQGAPCTGELKVKPRIAAQRDGDVHVFGYTADAGDVKRAKMMSDNWPDIETRFPLIDRGLTKHACLAMLYNAGIEPPRVYALGFQHANCVPCVKSTSPKYWAIIREHFPEQFERMATLEQRLGAKLIRVKGKRVTLRELPDGYETSEPIAPACDFLCGLAEQELEA